MILSWHNRHRGNGNDSGGQCSNLVSVGECFIETCFEIEVPAGFDEDLEDDPEDSLSE